MLLSPKSEDRPVKKPSIFGIFSVREPSTQAWLQYQQEIKRLQETDSVGLAMVSTAKLPKNVPKVNSRWNGMPEIQKRSKNKARANNDPEHDPFQSSFSGMDSLQSSSSKTALPADLAQRAPSRNCRSSIGYPSTFETQDSDATKESDESAAADILADMCSGYNKKKN